MVSDEELEVQVDKGEPNTKCDSMSNLGLDQFNNYESTGPRQKGGP